MEALPFALALWVKCCYTEKGELPWSLLQISSSCASSYLETSFLLFHCRLNFWNFISHHCFSAHEVSIKEELSKCLLHKCLALMLWWTVSSLPYMWDTLLKKKNKNKHYFSCIINVSLLNYDFEIIQYQISHFIQQLNRQSVSHGIFFSFSWSHDIMQEKNLCATQF